MTVPRSCPAAASVVVAEQRPAQAAAVWMRAFLAAISYFHRVAYSSAIPSSEIRNVSRIDPGRLPPDSVSTRGCTYCWARRTAMKFSGTNAPATIENTLA